MLRFGRENWDNTKFFQKKVFFSPQPTDMEEKGNSESLLLHIEDFCPKQVARICHSKKHLTVRSKNRFEASTNQAIYPP